MQRLTSRGAVGGLEGSRMLGLRALHTTHWCMRMARSPAVAQAPHEGIEIHENSLQWSVDGVRAIWGWPRCDLHVAAPHGRHV